MAKTTTPSTTDPSLLAANAGDNGMLFTRKHYILMILGIVLMALGYIAMSGGSMPDSNTWDESLIYGWRRTVLAPLLILGGLGVEVYAIFKR